MSLEGEERRRDLVERIAVLEAEVCSLKKELTAIEGKIDKILDEMTRYKGFIGGVTFIVSGAYLTWQLVGDHIKKVL